MSLGYIITKRNLNNQTSAWLVAKIKDYTPVSEENKRFYCCDNPCVYTEIDNRVFSGDLSEICEVDFSKSLGNIGNCYKIPKESVKLLFCNDTKG